MEKPIGALDLAVDPQGVLYIADLYGLQRVSGGVRTTLIPNYAVGPVYGTNALAVDALGNVDSLWDQDDFRVRPASLVTRLMGASADGLGFDNPYRIGRELARDEQMTLYVTHTRTQSIHPLPREVYALEPPDT